MNANELADALEKDPMRWTILENAITMLRQQQAEIEKLKAEVVSYRTDAEKLTMRLIDIAVQPKAKELTDKEITNCLIEWAKVEHADEYSDPTAEELAPIIRMIKAILRKAQEK